jgi:hypothetical protein
MRQAARTQSFGNGITGWLEIFLATRCHRVKLFLSMWVLDLQRAQVCEHHPSPGIARKFYTQLVYYCQGKVNSVYEIHNKLTFIQRIKNE